MLGSSGVGKSTLVNALLGTERQRTSAVREDDSRGRHTTTHRELVRLPGGALLIDTPGIRSLGVAGASEGLEQTFADIAELAAGCRFGDCRHEGEPGCAVRAALADGRLDADRFASHRKLEREAAHVARANDPLLRAAERRKWRAIHASVPSTCSASTGATDDHAPSPRRRRAAGHRRHLPRCRASTTSPAWPQPTPALRARSASSSRSTSTRCATATRTSSTRTRSTTASSSSATAPPSGYARIEWHDLVDGDRIYDTTLVVAPAPGARDRRRAPRLVPRTRARRARRGQPDRPARGSPATSVRRRRGARGRPRGRGYEAVRWDAEMLRPDLEDLPAEPVPDGYELRIADAGRAARAVFEMMVAAFRTTGASTRRRSSGSRSGSRILASASTSRSCAWRGDEPAACVLEHPRHRYPTARSAGCSTASATHPDHRRLGLAAPHRRSLRLLRDAGATTAFLGVDTDNHNRALALYESCGFRHAASGADFPQTLSPMRDDR